MTKDEVIADGYRQVKMVPTHPQFPTHIIAVKNKDFDTAAISYNATRDSFNLFYFLLFRQKTVITQEKSKPKEVLVWEFEGFANSNKIEMA